MTDTPITTETCTPVLTLRADRIARKWMIHCPPMTTTTKLLSNPPHPHSKKTHTHTKKKKNIKKKKSITSTILIGLCTVCRSWQNPVQHVYYGVKELRSGTVKIKPDDGRQWISMSGLARQWGKHFRPTTNDCHLTPIITPTHRQFWHFRVRADGQMPRTE